MFVVFANVFADTLYLKNGTQFKGRMVRQDDEKITFVDRLIGFFMKKPFKKPFILLFILVANLFLFVGGVSIENNENNASFQLFLRKYPLRIQ